MTSTKILTMLNGWPILKSFAFAAVSTLSFSDSTKLELKWTVLKLYEPGQKKHLWKKAKKGKKVAAFKNFWSKQKTPKILNEVLCIDKFFLSDCLDIIMFLFFYSYSFLWAIFTIFIIIYHSVLTVMFSVFLWKVALYLMRRVFQWLQSFVSSPHHSEMGRTDVNNKNWLYHCSHVYFVTKRRSQMIYCIPSLRLCSLMANVSLEARRHNSFQASATNYSRSFWWTQIWNKLAPRSQTVV